MKDIKQMTLGEIEDHRRMSAEIEKALGCPKSEILKVELNESSPYKVGAAFLIRTVTFYYVGKIKQDFGAEISLSDASWIPDTGRYSECLKSGKFNEVEKIPEYVIVPKSGIIDLVPWAHSLPTETK